MITINGVTKRFGDLVLFEHYSRQFTGDKVCITADNGTGKTTLLSMIAGLDKPCQGEIVLQQKRAAKRHHVVALASDCIPFPEFLSARDLLMLSTEAWQCQFPEYLIAGFHFTPFLDTAYADLSSGNKKKLQLINALMRQAPYLLLDEPSATLDHGAVQFLLEVLNRYHGVIVITSHEPEPFLAAGFSLAPLFTKA